MSELGEVFSALKKDKSKKKRQNIVDSTNVLKAARIEFESKNGGIHLIVKGKNSTIDFWPSTGKFIEKGIHGEKGRGVKNLLKLC